MSVSGSALIAAMRRFTHILDWYIKQRLLFFFLYTIISQRVTVNVCEQTSERLALCIDFVMVFVACVRCINTPDYTYEHSMAMHR